MIGLQFEHKMNDKTPVEYIEYELWSADWDVGSWDEGWGGPEYWYMTFCWVRERRKLTHEFHVRYDPNMQTTEKPKYSDFICTCKPCFEHTLYHNELDKFHTFLFNLCLMVGKQHDYPGYTDVKQIEMSAS